MKVSTDKETTNSAIIKLIVMLFCFLATGFVVSTGVTSCGNGDEDTDSDSDTYIDGDGDSDSDSDSDGNFDGDINEDSDIDSDRDVDSSRDSDRDIDSDTDNDLDIDVDFNEDADIDRDESFDGDVDEDEEVDSDEDYIEEIECIHPEVVDLCIDGWCIIPAGCFTMGSPLDEVGRFGDERQHDVLLTHDFEIMSTEVTQSQFMELMGYNPSGFWDCGDDCPVENVDWDEAAAFCNALSRSAGLDVCYDCIRTDRCDLIETYLTAYDCTGYRLPTEAEWEYAARAGITTTTYNGDLDVEPDSCETSAVLDSIAWWCANSETQSHNVGILEPNAWGLYDMLGNVMEWCNDIYSTEEYRMDFVIDPIGGSRGRLRISRGGSWYYDASNNRAAKRNDVFHYASSSSFGIRPVRTLDI